MKRTIADEFTFLPISRQRKYQLRRQRDGRCTQCGRPVIAGKRCLKHLVEARERQRQRNGLKRRYLGTLSYKLQARPARLNRNTRDWDRATRARTPSERRLQSA